MKQDSDARVQSESLHNLRKDEILKWCESSDNSSIFTRPSNIIIHLPGAKGAAKSCKVPIEFFKLFTSEDITKDLNKKQIHVSIR